MAGKVGLAKGRKYNVEHKDARKQIVMTPNQAVALQRAANADPDAGGNISALVRKWIDAGCHIPTDEESKR